MMVAVEAVGAAILLGVVGIALAYRARRDPVWQGECPYCRGTISLPSPVCQVCGEDLKADPYPVSSQWVEFDKRALLRSSLIRILLAWIVLLVAVFLL